MLPAVRAAQNTMLTCAAMAPKEYMNFMRRATVYLALGRTRQAIKDYDAVLDLKADFAQVCP